jgi:hypothetical protein
MFQHIGNGAASTHLQWLLPSGQLSDTFHSLTLRNTLEAKYVCVCLEHTKFSRIW